MRYEPETYEATCDECEWTETCDTEDDAVRLAHEHVAANEGHTAMLLAKAVVSIGIVDDATTEPDWQEP